MHTFLHKFVFGMFTFSPLGPKIKILSLFTHPHVVLKAYALFCFHGALLEKNTGFLPSELQFVVTTAAKVRKNKQHHKNDPCNSCVIFQDLQSQMIALCEKQTFIIFTIGILSLAKLPFSFCAVLLFDKENMCKTNYAKFVLSSLFFYLTGLCR